MVAEQQAPGTVSFTLTATQSFGEGMCQLTMVPNMSSPTSVVNLLTANHAFTDNVSLTLLTSHYMQQKKETIWAIKFLVLTRFAAPSLIVVACKVTEHLNFFAIKSGSTCQSQCFTTTSPELQQELGSRVVKTSAIVLLAQRWTVDSGLCRSLHYASHTPLAEKVRLGARAASVRAREIP